MAESQQPAAEGSGPSADPRAELAELAHGLARSARRRQAMGLRRAGPRAAHTTSSAAIALNASHNEQSPPPISALAAGATTDEVRRAAAACAGLDTLAAAVAACRACPLGATRERSVFADGAGARRVLFVGEAPGYHEDQTGVPFVGAAGQLLTDIIAKGMGLDRARDVTICNVLKCRPPGNRDPLPAEEALCTAWLDRQIELVDPLLIVALGRHAANHLLGADGTLGRLRGKVHRRGTRPVVVTYHPAYLLRNPADKRACWQDIQLALRVLGLQPPGATAN
jgi:DNA polymerase